MEPYGLNIQTTLTKPCEIVTGPSDPPQDTVRPTIPAVISTVEVPLPTCPSTAEVQSSTPLTVVADSSKPAGSEELETCASRQQKRAEGFYVKGTVMGIDVLFCVDTGASSTILSSKVYQKIPPDDRPPLRPALPHSTADGSAMKCMGRAEFPIRMGKLELVVTLTIAEITDDVLLGADLMHDGEEQPFDLLISEQRISWKGVSIPLTIASSPGSTRHIYAADHYVIPGMSEMVVGACFDRGVDDKGDNSVLIEPASKMAESLHLAMPMCLVNVQSSTTEPVSTAGMAVLPSAVGNKSPEVAELDTLYACVSIQKHFQSEELCAEHTVLGVVLTLFLFLILFWISSNCDDTYCSKSPTEGSERAEGRPAPYNLRDRSEPKFHLKNKWWVSKYGWDCYGPRADLWQREQPNCKPISVPQAADSSEPVTMRIIPMCRR